MMLVARWKIVALHLLGVMAMALVVGNAFLFTGNRKLQAEVNTRAQYVQQTAQLRNLYQNLAQGLAELAVQGNDPQLMQVLAAQGISVSVNRPTKVAATAQSPASVSAPAAKAAKR